MSAPGKSYRPGMTGFVVEKASPVVLHSPEQQHAVSLLVPAESSCELAGVFYCKRCDEVVREPFRTERFFYWHGSGGYPNSWSGIAGDGSAVSVRVFASRPAARRAYEQYMDWENVRVIRVTDAVKRAEELLAERERLAS